MAPKTFIYIALILSGVFVFNIPATCLTQSSDNTGINKQNQVQKDLTEEQQIEKKQDLKVIPKYRRALTKVKSRSMYALNEKIRFQSC